MLVFSFLEEGYSYSSDKLTTKSNCVMCGDRFLCGATKERVKLTLYGERKSDSIKEHCLKRNVRISENIRVSGIKSEEDGRHQTLIPYVENLIKKRKGTKQSRFEKGFKLGELKYFIQPTKKESKKSYKKLKKAHLLLPVKSFDNFKISMMPDRPVSEYRNYVHGIMTQDPYHLSSKDNAHNIFLFAVHPDGGALRAGKALSRNIASTLGGGGSSGGSSGGGAGGSSGNAKSDTGAKSSKEEKPKNVVEMNDQGEWAVKPNTENSSSNSNIDMSVLSGNSSGGKKGADGPSLSSYDPSFEGLPRAPALNKYSKRGAEIADRRNRGLQGLQAPKENSGVKTVFDKGEIENRNKKTEQKEETSSVEKDKPRNRNRNSRRSYRPSNNSSSEDTNSSEPVVQGTTPASENEHLLAQSLSLALSQARNKRMGRKLSGGSLSGSASNQDQNLTGEGQGMGSVEVAVSLKAQEKLDKKLKEGLGESKNQKGEDKEKWSCDQTRKLITENYKNKRICGLTLKRYNECEEEYRASILKKCGKLFQGKYPVNEDQYWVDEGKGNLTSIQRCAEKFEKMTEQYMPRKMEGAIPTNLVSSFKESPLAKELDMKLWGKVKKKARSKKNIKYSKFYCSDSKKYKKKFGDDRKAMEGLISIKTGKKVNEVNSNCSSYVDKYLPGIMAKYEKESPAVIKSNISDNILNYAGANYIKKGERKIHPSTLKGDKRMKFAENNYKRLKELYSDLKLYMEESELSNFISKGSDHEIGTAIIMEEKIELNVRNRCPFNFKEEAQTAGQTK